MHEDAFERSGPQEDRMSRVINLMDRATWVLALASGLCLIGIMSVIVLGVVMRYVFASPLLGVNEIIQLAAVAMVMSALPYCTFQQEHVAVDVFEHRLGRWGRFIGDMLALILPIFAFAVLAQRATLKTLDAWEWSDATNMLRLPIWPLYGVLACGAGLCVLVFLVQLATRLQRGPVE
jgi:TRAP-type C4-dicarboxylate transport system permease small subunit